MTATVSTAIEAGLDFLLHAQHDEGWWSDWALAPGPSCTWTTAYVGWRLSGLRSIDIAGTSLDRAAAWLATAGHPDGGWSYGPSTDPDADSTALAVRFLRARGVYVPSAVDWLLRYRQPDGGFATFSTAWNHGAWARAQPEITAAVLDALAADLDTPPSIFAPALRYLQDVRAPNGLWPSYWWTTPLYATEAALTALAAWEPSVGPALARVVDAVPACCAFDRAVQVLALVRAGDIAAGGRRAEALLAAQLPDGSWPSHPVLRLTHRHIVAPWSASDAGPLFADERRTFATVTAVAALDACLAAAGER